jgi:adenylosuccinate lyase
MSETLPKPRKPKEYTFNPADLAAGRYGTYEMVQLWGPERTFEYSLRTQAEALLLLSKHYPDIVSIAEAEEVSAKANIQTVNPDRIRELEEKGSHDVIAINTALEEKVSREAGSHINKARTSADTTETAKALQLKKSLEVIANSIENLRDVLIEKALLWIDVPHIDQTHNYDALPTVAGRAFAHYAEMLQSDLDFIKFVYNFSIKGKWGDATGNHHSATTLGIDGMKLQEEYCKKLGIGFMIAAAQVPGREFEADIAYALARTGETLNNIAKYIRKGRGDDMNIFLYVNPKKKKGSSAMPHKDSKNGNPTTEEQNSSFRNYILGNLVTAMANCEMDYGRDLNNSANNRINLEDGFKFADHAIRTLAETIYYIKLKEERCKERIERSYGCTTAEQAMTYLTDKRYVSNPLTRHEAHELIAGLATAAWESKTQFRQVLIESDEVRSLLSEQKIMELTDPLFFIGQSKEIIREIANLYHGRKIFGGTT